MEQIEITQEFNGNDSLQQSELSSQEENVTSITSAVMNAMNQMEQTLNNPVPSNFSETADLSVFNTESIMGSFDDIPPVNNSKKTKKKKDENEEEEDEEVLQKKKQKTRKQTVIVDDSLGLNAIEQSSSTIDKSFHFPANDVIGAHNANDGKEFELTFNQPDTLRKMLQIISSCYDDIPLQIYRNNEFEGIKVDTMTPEHTGILSARLTCIVVGNAGTHYFSTKKILLALKNLPKSACLKLVKYLPVEKMYGYVFQGDNPIPTWTFDIDLKENEELMHGQIINMNHKYTVDINLDAMKQIISTASACKAEYIEFTIKEPKDGRDPESQWVIPEDFADHVFLEIKVEGEGISFTRCFHSILNRNSDYEDEESYTVKILDEEPIPEAIVNSLEKTYTDTFSRKKLEEMYKHMQNRSIKIRLSNDIPMLTHYSLGNQQSYIQFLLGAKVME